VNRPRVSFRTMGFAGALVVLVSVVGCGPRLKPVEYEEPATASGSGDDTAVTSGDSSSSSSSASASDSSASSDGGKGTSAASDGAYSACKEKKCGDSCTACAPGDSSCAELQILKQCSGKGECVAAPVSCAAGKKKDKSSDKPADKSSDKPAAKPAAKK
jgi:hypothetical protein